MIPPKSPTPARPSCARRHFTTDISREWADLLLILCYFITGMLDSASTSVWGSFVSMQTGNTVYIGLGLSVPGGSTRWIKSLTSLLSFCLGAFVFSRFHRHFSPARRWVLVTSCLAQFLLTAAAAAMVTRASSSSSASNHTSNLFAAVDDRLAWDILLPIALIAFQSAGQAVASRALKYPALTSVVLTSVYCDLFSDPALFAGLLPTFSKEEGAVWGIGKNPDRNRRAAAPLALLLGAFAGGWLVREPLGVAAPLWAAAGIKVVVMVAWMVWPGVKEVREEGRLPA
ncbi:hypothetical protein VTJ04DRAFT_7345 [Mycothermus thermophilus]|uniref:uncharacterized protein n=1 Tax=Humicola insolens TaxID=85995 RepID=UPI0037444E63